MFCKLVYVIVLDWDNVCSLFLCYMFIVICGLSCEVFMDLVSFQWYVFVDYFFQVFLIGEILNCVEVFRKICLMGVCFVVVIELVRDEFFVEVVFLYGVDDVFCLFFILCEVVLRLCVRIGMFKFLENDDFFLEFENWGDEVYIFECVGLMEFEV